MMLRYTLQQEAAADAIEAAVRQVLKNGLRCADIAGQGTDSSLRVVGNTEKWVMRWWQP